MLRLKIKAEELAGLVPRELLGSASLARRAAEGVREKVAAHFEARGGRRFWQGAARSTAVTADVNGAVVQVSQRGVALRYYGGVVRPVRGKALAVPTQSNKSDLWPREYGGRLRLIPREKRPPLLALVEGRGKNQRVVPKFVLVKKTTHQADATVLPSEEEMRAAAIQAITKQ